MDRGRDIEREGRESERERERERERGERGEERQAKETRLSDRLSSCMGTSDREARQKAWSQWGQNQIISRRKTPTGGFTQKLQETVSDTLVFFPSHSVAVGLAQPHQSAGCLSRPTLPSRVLFAFSGRYGGERGHRLRDLFR